MLNMYQNSSFRNRALALAGLEKPESDASPDCSKWSGMEQESIYILCIYSHIHIYAESSLNFACGLRSIVE